MEFDHQITVVLRGFVLGKKLVSIIGALRDKGSWVPLDVKQSSDPLFGFVASFVDSGIVHKIVICDAEA